MMTNKLTFLSTALLTFVTCLSFCNLAQAADNAAIKSAFSNDPIMLFSDAVGAEWQIVQAENEDEALASKKPLFKGVTDAHGNALLSPGQRSALYAAWQRKPQQLWYIQFPHVLQIMPQQAQGRYTIALVDRKIKAEHEAAEARSKANTLAATTPLSPGTYTQQGFDAKPFIDDYQEWRERFQQDISAIKANIKSNSGYGRALLEDKNPDALKQVFAQSIHTGKKGLSLRSELIASYFGKRTTEETVTPSGDVFTQLTLSADAKPVGFGGTFVDDGNTVELWYMVFDDMSKWSMRDFNESLVFSAFNPAALPPYKTIKRNSWPALAFIRDANGKIMLYATSMEMAQIIQHIFNKQIG